MANKNTNRSGGGRTAFLLEDLLESFKLRGKPVSLNMQKDEEILLELAFYIDLLVDLAENPKKKSIRSNLPVADQKKDINTLVVDYYTRYRDEFVSLLVKRGYYPNSKNLNQNGNKNFSAKVKRLPSALKFTLWLITYSMYMIHHRNKDIKFPFTEISVRGITGFINEEAKPKNVGISKNFFNGFVVSPYDMYLNTTYKDIVLPNVYAGEKKGYLGYAIRSLMLYADNYTTVLDLFGGSGRASTVFERKTNVSYCINEWNFFNVNYYLVLGNENLCTQMVDLLKSWGKKINDFSQEESYGKLLFNKLNSFISTSKLLENLFIYDDGELYYTSKLKLEKNYDSSTHAPLLKELIEVLIYCKDIFNKGIKGYRYSEQIEALLNKHDFSSIKVSFDENNLEDIYYIIDNLLMNVYVKLCYFSRFTCQADAKFNADKYYLACRYNTSELYEYFWYTNDLIEADRLWRKCDAIRSSFLTYFKNKTSKYIKTDYDWEDIYKLIPDEYKVYAAASFIFLNSTLINDITIQRSGVEPSTIKWLIDYNKSDNKIDTFLKQMHPIFKKISVYNTDALFDDEYLISQHKEVFKPSIYTNGLVLREAIIEKIVQSNKGDSKLRGKLKTMSNEKLYDYAEELYGEDIEIDINTLNSYGRCLIYSDSPYLGTMSYSESAKTKKENKNSDNYRDTPYTLEEIKEHLEKIDLSILDGSDADKIEESFALDIYVDTSEADGGINNEAMIRLIDKLDTFVSEGNDIIFSCRVNPAVSYKKFDTVDLSKRDKDGCLTIDAFKNFRDKRHDLNNAKKTLYNVYNVYKTLFSTFDSKENNYYVLLCLKNEEKFNSDLVMQIDANTPLGAENDELINKLMTFRFKEFKDMEVFITSFDFIAPLDYDDSLEENSGYTIYKKYTLPEFMKMLRERMLMCTKDELDSWSIVKDPESSTDYMFKK